MNLVFSEYAEALRLDPKHRGAHEYLGEAYLQINEVAKAREQRASLSKLCTFGCEEYSDVKQSLKQYEFAHPQWRSLQRGAFMGTYLRNLLAPASRIRLAVLRAWAKSTGLAET
jgi:hypothetical protein